MGILFILVIGWMYTTPPFGHPSGEGELTTPPLGHPSGEGELTTPPLGHPSGEGELTTGMKVKPSLGAI